MAKSKDAARFDEDTTKTDQEVSNREQLEAFITKSVGTNVEKMANFSKYVPRKSLTRVLAKYEIFKRVLDVHGSVVECGVLFGGGLMSWAQFSAILEPVNWPRKIIGFDTFAGFRGVGVEDEGPGKSRHAKDGGLSIDTYEDLQQCIELFDLDRTIGHIPKVELVKGDANETIPRYLKENDHLVVSLLYLDFDIYGPTKTALECFVPRMPKGAIVAFDELNSALWPGETMAVFDQIGIRNLRIERIPFDSAISFAALE